MIAFLKTTDPIVISVAQLLKCLNVKVSLATIKTALDNHPDYPGILSLSDVLKRWKVENCILQADKEKLHELPLPFIAHVRDKPSFITVTQITNSHVIYQSQKGKPITTPLQTFLEKWSGVVLQLHFVQ